MFLRKTGIGQFVRAVVCGTASKIHRNRVGLIRFGSRTDIFVPEGTELKVKKDDIVSGGSSIIGYLK